LGLGEREVVISTITKLLTCFEIDSTERNPLQIICRCFVKPSERSAVVEWGLLDRSGEETVSSTTKALLCSRINATERN